MEIQSTKFENAVVLKVSGRMDAENTHQFQSACQQWIAKGETPLVSAEVTSFLLSFRPRRCKVYRSPHDRDGNAAVAFRLLQ